MANELDSLELELDLAGVALEAAANEPDPFAVVAAQSRSEVGEAEATGHEWSPDKPIELVNPITGEVIDRDNVDAMVEALEQIKKLDSELYTAKVLFIKAIADKTEGPNKVRYLRGETKRVKVTMTGTDFEQKLVRQAWDEFPQYRDKVLKISEISVMKREFAKIVKESGSDDFEKFKKILILAEKPKGGNPTISIEE